ncbi:MAG: short-chain dehydrogenase [Rhodospirillaceae bacterium]|nr:short-chain dehydrogenase [Rhodospirillaceae bacterium]|tara:strand:+ start:7057 stop:7830 length:774 start_codon:yes stop_codon:yes gene_type:complete
MGFFDLEGQVAVITGGSKGIGRAIAERMAEGGAKVVISSRKVDACQEVVDGIKAKGGEALAVGCNVTHVEQLQHLVDESMKAYGRIDCLVGNAAVNPHYGPMTTIKEPAFQKIVDCNIRANLWLSKMVLPQMAERKDGTIIIISSIAGIKGTDDIGMYGVSKAADMAMARNLAVRWGEHNIRVNTIAPGLIKTDFAKALWEDPERRAKVEAQYPLRRIGDPDDIAGVAVFLAADAGRYITGQTIVVDGGSTIVAGGI